MGEGTNYADGDDLAGRRRLIVSDGQSKFLDTPDSRERAAVLCKAED
jgi:hypothetical protein